MSSSQPTARQDAPGGSSAAVREALSGLGPWAEPLLAGAVLSLAAVMVLAFNGSLREAPPASPLERCAMRTPEGGALVVRPTFCNVPHWAELTLYVMSVVALGILALGVWRHWSAWMGGQSGVPARNIGQPARRLRHLLTYAIAQRKTAERRYPGIFHGGMFAGFGLLFVGTTLATVDWDVTRQLWGGDGPLSGRILQGTFYLGYEAVLDAAGLVFLIGLGLAVWRRHIQEPHHVKGSWDFMLWLLILINLSGFLVEGLRLVVTQPALAHRHWSWLGNAIANTALSLGGGPTDKLLYVAGQAHLWLWLLHAGASLLFIAALPYSNAIHILTVSANAWFKTTETIGAGAALSRIDLENAEVWGVGSVDHLTWKQRLGVDACVRCGRCETVCPAYMSGSALNPKEIIVSLSDALRAQADGPFLVGDGGRILVGDGLVITPEALWSCTTCLACVQVCPAFIEIVDNIVDLRRYLTLNEGALPGTSSQTLKNMGSAGNPWGYSAEDRLGWAEGLDLPIAQPGQHVELLYWVGCSASYDKRNQKIARSMVALLREAGVSFAVMREERCTCESARRLGEEYLYQGAAEGNVAAISGYSFDRLLCHCPHCFNTLRNEYPQFGGNFDVVHHSQLLDELVRGGRLKAQPGNDQRVVFHDSCYLGRYNGEYEAPRHALAASGVQVLEAEQNREAGLCCGGGGGKMWFEGHADREVNLIRMEALLATKPDVVSVACPYCLTMLDSAAKTMGVEGVQVRDIAEVLADGMA